MKLPRLFFGATHASYHFMMFLIASACLGLLIWGLEILMLIARKVGAL